jgi:hypothetical protein
MSDHAHRLATEPPLPAGSSDGNEFETWWLWSTYQVTVTFSPTHQTVSLSGVMIGGTQTSLFDNKCKLERLGVGAAETPRAKKKRSAALTA